MAPERRTFSPEELEILKEMWEQGRSLSSIRLRLKCGYISLRREAAKLNLKIPPNSGLRGNPRNLSTEEYNELRDMVESGCRIGEVMERFKCGYYRAKRHLAEVGNKTKIGATISLSERIDALEEHIRIIYEEIENGVHE